MRSANILGVDVVPFTIDDLHCAIEETVGSSDKAIYPYINVYGANIAYKDEEFRKFLNSTGGTFCDGYGAVLGARILGYNVPQKITYAHWFPLFCDFAAEKGISIFLLGSKPGVAEEAKRRLCELRPKLNIVGVHDGYFNKEAGSAENRDVVQMISSMSPDVLLVAFGMPLQEKWLAENWESIDARVALTGGAAIDYMAGASKRPPKWMTDHGLEWFGRMMYEPRRLWKRYLIGNPLFMFRVLKQLLFRRK